jgi:hypothetical protein
MTPSDPDLRTILRKSKRYQMGQWVGHLTPSEAHLLVQAGATAGSQDIDRTALRQRRGAMFYFSAKPALRLCCRRPCVRRRPDGVDVAVGVLYSPISPEKWS